jgi:hypothetical protein
MQYPSTFLSILCIFSCVLSLSANSPLEVDAVDFNKPGDDWVQMEIQLSCNENTLPDAKNPDFVDNAKVTAYVTYASDDKPGEFSYYMSEVAIVSMERGEKYNVYFYLPGLIVERDGLKNEPEYYYVKLSIGDVEMPLEGGSAAMSRSIKSPQALESMISNAKAADSDNKGIFMPHYLAPAEYLGRVSRLPTFRRYDYNPLSK